MREIRFAVFGALIAAYLGLLPIVAFAPAPPLTPTGFTATPADQKVSLQWSPPSGNPSQVPTSYTLTYSPGNVTQSYSAITRAATVSPLTNGVLYTFNLTAIGPGGASQPATATATPKPPPPPPPPSPNPTPSPTPQPTPSPTPQGGIGVDPAAAPAASRVNISGNGLPANADLPLLFDGVAFDHAPTDAAGNLAKSVGIPDTAAVGDHLICVDEGAAGKVCANFHVTPAAPSPAASPTAAPTPSPTPVASPTPIALAVQPPPSSGSSPLGFITRPPFVFFPILLLLAALGWFGYWLWTQRPGPALGEVTVVHKAAPPRTWTQEPPPEVTPPPTPAPAPAPPPAINYETPSGPRPPSPTPLGPGAPSTADVPPDLPEALD